MVGNVSLGIPRLGLASGKSEVFFRSCRLGYGVQGRACSLGWLGSLKGVEWAVGGALPEVLRTTLASGKAAGAVGFSVSIYFQARLILFHFSRLRLNSLFLKGSKTEHEDRLEIHVYF